MVPLKPNELKRELSSLAEQHLDRVVFSTGVKNEHDHDSRIDDRCTFSRHSCALTETKVFDSGITATDARPAAAAAASRWPKFDLREAHCTSGWHPH